MSIKQIIVQLDDGSTWTAEYTVDGKLNLLKQLNEPTEPEKAKPDGDVSEEELLEEIDKDAEYEWVSEEEAEEVGAYSDEDLEKLLEGMESRELREIKERRPENRRIRITMPDGLLSRLKDTAFKERLSSVMLDNKYDRRIRGRTRGKLDMNRLYKVPTGSRSVFTQKQSRKGKEYNVVLLVDRSGSMSGRKAELAAESAVFLTKQLTDIGVNVGIITFDTNVNVHKSLEEKPDYEYIYSQVASAQGDNCDFDAMRRAYAMLDKASGKKIMIMLSDGQPVGYYPARTFDSHGKEEKILKPLPSWEGFDSPGDYEEAEDFTGGINYDTREHFHHLAKSQKDVSSIGIGIEQGGWQVPDHTVIHDVGDLKKTIITALRRHIVRG